MYSWMRPIELVERRITHLIALAIPFLDYQAGSSEFGRFESANEGD